MIKAIEEEYWTFQYRTDAIGRGLYWWPETYSDRYNSEEGAAAAARHHSERHGGQEVRLVFVERKLRFGDTLGPNHTEEAT